MDREDRNVARAIVIALGLALGGCDSGSPGPPYDPEPFEPVLPPTFACDSCPKPPSSTNLDAVQAEPPPPPISGGTLLLTRDGKWLVATDPDRDQVYFVDAEARRFSHSIAVQSGDEPGRSAAYSATMETRVTARPITRRVSRS